MIELGKSQTLIIVKKTDFGAYLGINEEDKSPVLLPKKYITSDFSIGDSIEVFIYKDSDDRIIATTLKPAIELGEVAKLKVKEVTPIGAFLDWGLEKDLLLPYKEQPEQVITDNEYLVALYIDKSKRLCATMNVYDYLQPALIYNKNDTVTGTVYDIKEKYGVFIAIDNKYYGLLPNSEISKTYKIGETIEARITNIRDDGKLGLSVREKINIQIEKDSELIYNKLLENNGTLHFTDKSNPSHIKEEFNLSKNAFKRAVGRLLKEGKITLTENAILISSDI